MDILNVELKPCPFCASSTAPRLTDNLDLGVHDDTEMFGYTINCDGGKGGCGTTCGYYENVEEVIELWNRGKFNTVTVSDKNPEERIKELEDAIKNALSWSNHRPPVPEEFPAGTMVNIRQHALADLHKALFGEYAKPNA